MSSKTIVTSIIVAIMSGTGAYYRQQAQLSSCTQRVCVQEEISINTNISDNAIPQNIRDLRTHPLIIDDTFIGFVRVILLEEGNEHIYTPFIIQWLDDNHNITKEITSNTSRQGSDLWSLGITTLENNIDGILIKLSGTHTYSLEDKEFSIQVGQNDATGNFFME